MKITKEPEKTHQELLSKTEQKLFEIIGRGILSNAYIGNELNVSPHTIKNHKENIKKKLKVDSCQELLMLAVENSKKE